MRASRAAKKAAKLAEGQPKEPIPSTSKMNNAQNPGLEKFQKLQTPPKGLSHKGRLPHRNDRTLTSGSGLIVDTMSDYEKLREKNILERQQKFKERFGTLDRYGGPSHSRKQSMPQVSSKSQNDDFSSKSKPGSSRQMPKRNCNLQKTCPQLDSSKEGSDTSFDGYVEDLVESAVANFELNQREDTKSLIVPIVESLIASVIKPMSGVYKRKFSIGRKSKHAKKSKIYRENETTEQYKKRLRQSAKYNRNLPENENQKRKHIRRLKR